MVFSETLFREFSDTYYQELDRVLRDFDYLEAYVGKSFSIDEEGDAIWLMTGQPTHAERFLAYFLTDEIDAKLAQLDWTMVSAKNQNFQHVASRVHAAVLTRITFRQNGLEILIRCNNKDMFANLFAAAGQTP